MLDILIDMEFGDEDNGKIIDYLANDYDVVARFNGGENSEHSIYYNNKKYALHLIPSGIFYNKICIIGNGVVINPVSLKKEIELLEADGINVKENLYISKNAHIVTPYHIHDDKIKEEKLKIGTTGKGIGPCYTSKVERTGVRVCDINDEYIQNLITSYEYDTIHKFDTQTMEEYVDALKYLLTLKTAYLESYLNTNLEILAEGAQGTLLDVDFGTYPYVSSSNSTIGGVMTGLGVSHKKIGNVFGVFKAYLTRVGNGPFVTELKDKTGDKIREIGNEFGATTGRPRRCGWLDLPALRYACMINGVDNLIMTKSDILNDFDEVKICIGYSFIDSEDGEEYSFYDYDNTIYSRNVKPIYKKFKGWNTKDNIEPLEDFIQFIEREVGVKVGLVSTGVGRYDLYNRE